MFEGNAATVIGRRVGNYVVERTLAQGGMGSVFVARHPALGREAAVKFLGQDQEVPPEMTKRFLDEARITAALRHPNIVDIFDFGELDGRLYYVMELLEGRDLCSLMRARRRFSWGEVLDCLEQVCAGLAAAHAVGVVHRDLKPGNIFVVRGTPPRIKLMDFGVAKVMTTQAEQTRYGQIIGTPRYMSPEQALGQIDRISPQSDFYSLGVIAYEMLTGTAPFEHESPVMLLVMHVRDAIKPIDSVVEGIPQPFSRLIEACLSKDPEDRPESAQSILDSLAGLRQSSEISLGDSTSASSIALKPVPEDEAALLQPSTNVRFVDADTVLGIPEPPPLTPVVERALEVISQRQPVLAPQPIPAD
ncbi:MAG TPA: serine/threonine-protein kinase, partial [Polyangiaceae bacterium]